VKQLILVLLVLPNLHAESNLQNPEVICINNHLLLGDTHTAVQTAYNALLRSPDEPLLHAAYIKALASAADEKSLFHAWEQYRNRFPEIALKQHELHEAMAWGIIHSGMRSTSPIVRISALLAALFGEDAKSVEILLHGTKDSNSIVRSAAVQLIAHMHDAPLCDRMLELFEKETSWPVRLEVIKALGKMKILKSRRSLALVLSSDRSCAEEKTASLGALVALLDEISPEELEKLANSDRAGLRQLACEVIGNLRSISNEDLLLKLADDSCGAVRASALHSLGLLEDSPTNNTTLKEIAAKHTNDPVADVAITAAWLGAMCEPSNASRLFAPWLTHEIPQRRRQAAAALASSGRPALKSALNQIKDLFQSTNDTYVKVNLALGMIRQRIEVDAACQQLYYELKNSTDCWMHDEESLFTMIVPASLEQCDGMVGPEEVNQLTRLELLNMLAIAKYPKAQEAIQEFLQKRKWGLTGIAAALLLTEGDESAIQLIDNILEQPTSPVKVQAALILALWGRDERAISTLEDTYRHSDRDMKEKILEGLGRIGALQSLPFLLDRFGEPQQTLRLIAASALLQCLYH
jgi:HEAT repeat protein